MRDLQFYLLIHIRYVKKLKYIFLYENSYNSLSKYITTIYENFSKVLFFNLYKGCLIDDSLSFFLIVIFKFLSPCYYIHMVHIYLYDFKKGKKTSEKLPITRCILLLFITIVSKRRNIMTLFGSWIPIFGYVNLWLSYIISKKNWLSQNTIT